MGTAVGRRAAIAAVGAIVLALSACTSSSGNASKATGGAPSGTLSIGWEASQRPGLDAVIAAFKTKYPAVNVNVSYAPVDAYQAAVRTQLQAGTAPDVLYTWPGNGNPGAIDTLAPSGFLADLSSSSWGAQYSNLQKSVSQVNGKTYLATPTIAAFGQLFNMDTMKKYGFTPPTTYTQALALCDAAKAKGLVAYSQPLGVSILAIQPAYALIATLVYAQTPDYDSQMTAGKTTFETSPGYQSVMSKYHEMLQHGCFDPKATSVALDASFSEVGSGKALGTITATPFLGAIKQAVPNANLLMSVFPSTDDVNAQWMSINASAGASLNARAKNPTAGRAFIDFLMSDTGVTTYAKGTGTEPGRTIAGYTPAPETKIVGQMLAANRAGAFPDVYWPNAQVQHALVVGVQAMFTGGGDGSNTLKLMDQAYKQK